MSTSIQIAVAVVPAVIMVVMMVFLWRVARRQQTQVTGPPAPPAAVLDPLGTDSLIQSISQRLAATEGRLGSVAAQLEGVAILQQRVASLEVNMPAVQEAFSTYADQVARADKRDTERQRRTDKDAEKFQTAGDAAAGLLGAAGAGGNPTLTQPAAPQPPNGRRRTGLVGSGGRNRK